MQIPNSQLWRGTRFGSDVYSETFGSYYHEYLLVEATQDFEQILHPSEMEQFVRDHPDVEVQAQRAMHDLTFLHEVRHFHDCFGTLAGAQA